MPERMVDILLGSPLLRGHVVHELRVAAAGRGARQFVLVVGIGRRYVAVESGLAGPNNGNAASAKRKIRTTRLCHFDYINLSHAVRSLAKATLSSSNDHEGCGCVYCGP
jgi:hypothetical protein